MSIYPACAGINLTILSADCENGNLPRMRGDQPAVVARRPVSFAFTPHARGSTYHDSWSMSRKIIYPACAGINPGERQVHRKHQHLPRRRGDQPNGYATCNAEKEFTPHARGSTSSIMSFITPMPIYPACAGITLSLLSLTRLSRIYPACAGINPVILSC